MTTSYALLFPTRCLLAGLQGTPVGSAPLLTRLQEGEQQLRNPHLDFQQPQSQQHLRAPSAQQQLPSPAVHGVVGVAAPRVGFDAPAPVEDYESASRQQQPPPALPLVASAMAQAQGPKQQQLHQHERHIMSRPALHSPLRFVAGHAGSWLDVSGGPLSSAPPGLPLPSPVLGLAAAASSAVTASSAKPRVGALAAGSSTAVPVAIVHSVPGTRAWTGAGADPLALLSTLTSSVVSADQAPFCTICPSRCRPCSLATSNFSGS